MDIEGWYRYALLSYIVIWGAGGSSKNRSLTWVTSDNVMLCICMLCMLHDELTAEGPHDEL